MTAHVVLRADASATLGHGHVSRCLALGNALVDRGVGVAIASRALPAALAARASAGGITVLDLPPGETRPGLPEALDPRWADDAGQTCAAFGAWGRSPDWVVVDAYAFDDRWERELRGSVPRIMAIDDLANRRHDCDVLVDQNLVAASGTRYRHLVADGCECLLGPAYALLAAPYAGAHAEARVRAGGVRRVLVFFGGADPQNQTGRVAAAFASLQREDVTLAVVALAGHPHRRELERLAHEHRNIVLYADQPTLAPLMLEADVAIGAAGSASWERLCLGLPALVVTLADNQVAIAAELDRQGLARSLGPAASVDEARWRTVLRELLESPLDAGWSARCLSAVDGLGASRVAGRLMARLDAHPPTGRQGARNTLVP